MQALILCRCNIVGIRRNPEGVNGALNCTSTVQTTEVCTYFCLSLSGGKDLLPERANCYFAD